jgi:RecJ-like exonuclease
MDRTELQDDINEKLNEVESLIYDNIPKRGINGTSFRYFNLLTLLNSLRSAVDQIMDEDMHGLVDCRRCNGTGDGHNDRDCPFCDGKRQVFRS